MALNVKSCQINNQGGPTNGQSVMFKSSNVLNWNSTNNLRITQQSSILIVTLDQKYFQSLNMQYETAVIADTAADVAAVDAAAASS